MNSRRTSISFLIAVILYFACAFGVGIVSLFFGNAINSLILSNMMVEAAIVLPGIMFALFSGESLPQFLGFHKIKVTTLLAIIPFTMLSMPLISLLNLITQFWVENMAVGAMEEYGIVQMPFWQSWFVIGLFAPFCEEVACRGLLYRGYEKSWGAFRAMILSAFLFALIHMNINQAVYAFAMGIMAILLVEATGSLWASVCYHALINSSQVALMYMMFGANSTAYSDAAQMMTDEILVTSVTVYLVITAVTLPLAWALLIWMSGNQERRGALLTLWRDRKEKHKKDNPAMLILALAVILCVAFIIWSMIII